MEITIAFLVVYLVGYCGALLINLATRRIVFKKLPFCGMVFLLVVATAWGAYIVSGMREDVAPYVVGRVLGDYVFGPLIIAGVVIGLWGFFTRGRN